MMVVTVVGMFAFGVACFALGFIVYGLLFDFQRAVGRR